MAVYFAVTSRFLDHRFHGRRDGGFPEWPPSPLRIFQALVASAGTRSRGKGISGDVRAALQWLEEISQDAPPVIVAPQAETGRGYRLSVPNNAMDIVASAWARGNMSGSGDADPRKHRAMKTIQPTLLTGGEAVHFLWSLPEELTPKVHRSMEVLAEVASSVLALGWGVDLVICCAAGLSEEQAQQLEGERWSPVVRGGRGWRVPVVGTLDALIERYGHFLGRLDANGTFTAPPPVTMFRVIGYRRSADWAARPFAAFALRDPETGRYCTFDPARQGLTLSGRMRHATHQAAVASRPWGWTDAQLAAFVLGHAEAKGSEHEPPGGGRFAYVPLPTIEARGGGGERVGAIRRVLLLTFSDDCDLELQWANQALAGQELIAEGDSRATTFLDVIPAHEPMIQRYSRASSTWVSVTPVVLPGHDDPRHLRKRLKKGVSADEQKQLLSKLDSRMDSLLRKAIVQAGLPKDLAEHADIEWRKVAFLAGVDTADRFGVPDHLRRFPRYHVQIGWRDVTGQAVRIPGPLCIGGGRFLGLGLLAPM